MSELLTSIEIINQILGENYGLTPEEVKEKFGEQAANDVQAVYKAAMAIQWYGSRFESNKSAFYGDCSIMFPGISEEALSNLHFSYAAGWMP